MMQSYMSSYEALFITSERFKSCSYASSGLFNPNFSSFRASSLLAVSDLFSGITAIRAEEFEKSFTATISFLPFSWRYESIERLKYFELIKVKRLRALRMIPRRDLDMSPLSNNNSNNLRFSVA